MDDALRTALIDLTNDLIRFPSTADRPDQLAAVAEYVARELATIPGLYIHRSERAGKPAIIATLHETRSPALLLNAHLDVVRGLPEQFEPAVRDGRIYGRGSQDMKGSAAVLLLLLKALSARDPRPDVGVQFVTDEEIGGMDGTGRLAREGWLCDFFITAEPTDLDICYEHKGGMRMDVIATGTPAHGSRPWAGRNPLLTLASGLAELTRRFPPPAEPAWITTITPTEFQAGAGSNNQIPPEARINLDIRFTPQDQPAQIAAAVQDCFPGATLHWRHTPPLTTDPAAPAVQRLAAVVAQVRGQPPQLYREHFGTDARFYSAAGIPAVCFGPVGAGLHSDEEWVAIDSLVQLYNVLERFCTE